MARACGGDAALIVNNGAVVKRKDGKTELRHLLSRDAARHILATVPVGLGHRHEPHPL